MWIGIYLITNHMVKYFKNIIPKSSFSKNVLTLMTGTTISQAIPVAISPILTRLYSPEDFGIFALFLSLTTIFGAVVTGRYELAVMLPKEDEKAKSIVALCILISLAFCSVLFVIIAFFHSYIVNLLQDESISIWLYCVPFVVFLIGLFNSLNYYFTRKKEFQNIAKANVSKSISLSFSQMLFYFVKGGAFGLVIGRIVSAIVAPVFLLYRLPKSEKIIFEKEKIKTVAKRYIDFPKYSVWAGLFNNLALNFNNLIIPIVFSTTILGYFALVYRVLVLPFTLVSESLGQVFFKEASELKNQQKDVSKVIWKIASKMGIISVLGFGTLFFIVEFLFVFIFGEEWRIAGQYAKYLIPMFMIRFIVSPLTLMHSVFEAHKLSLFLQFLMFLISIISMYIAYILELDFKQFLLIFSTLMVSFYLLRFIVIIKIAKNHYKKKLEEE